MRFIYFFIVAISFVVMSKYTSTFLEKKKVSPLTPLSYCHLHRLVFLLV